MQNFFPVQYKSKVILITRLRVAGPGVAPGLRDYEPLVRCTLPRMSEHGHYITNLVKYA